MTVRPHLPSSIDEEETAPFLGEDLEHAIKLESYEHGRQRSPSAGKITPLPMAQLASLCVVRMVDPISFTQIFPYVNEMMDYLHVTDDPSKIGFYSGLVESSFAISQFLSIYGWAKFSDKHGRRPAVLVGIAGTAITTMLLGFCRSLFPLLLIRFLSGFFSGNLAVMHAILGEITDVTNQAIAFPIYSLCWPIGSIVGPLIGGTFSRPADRLPQWFDYPLFRNFPYLLPCLMAGSIAAVGSIAGYFLLKETLPSKRHNRHYSDGSEKPVHSASIQYLWSIPVVRALCISGCFLAFINCAFDVIFVLFCYTPIEKGGLSFSAAEIGYSLATSGLVTGALQIFFMPYLLRRFDHAAMYNVCMAIWPFCYILLPGLNWIARSGVDSMAVTSAVVDPRTKVLLWIGIGGVQTLTRSACLAYSLSMILVKESAPDPSSLGATNGLAQFAMSFARAWSPAFASSLFAMSVGSSSLITRYLWVIIMASISMFGTTFSRKIAEGRKSPTPPSSRH